MKVILGLVLGFVLVSSVFSATALAKTQGTTFPIPNGWEKRAETNNSAKYMPKGTEYPNMWPVISVFVEPTKYDLSQTKNAFLEHMPRSHKILREGNTLIDNVPTYYIEREIPESGIILLLYLTVHNGMKYEIYFAAESDKYKSQAIDFKNSLKLFSFEKNGPYVPAKYELAKQWKQKMVEGGFDYLPALEDIEVDSKYVYVADSNANSIMKYDHDGKFIRDIEVKLDEWWCPKEVAVDNLGNIYAWIDDCVFQDERKLIKFNSDGKVIKEFPIIVEETRWSDYAKKNIEYELRANDIGVDSKGNVYLANSDRFFKIDGEGKVIEKIENPFPPNDQSPFRYLNKFHIDKYDNIIILDKDNSRIQKFSNDWKLLKTWNIDKKFVSQSVSFVVDDHDNLYYGSIGGQSIKHFDANGKLVNEFGQIKRKVDNPTLTSPFGGKQIENPQQTFSYITSIDMDPSGNIYVTRDVDFLIQKYSQTKSVSEKKEAPKYEKISNSKTEKEKTTGSTDKAKAPKSQSTVIPKNAITFENFAIVPPSGWHQNNYPPVGQGVSFLQNPPMTHPTLYAVNRSPFVASMDQVINSLHLDAGACKIIKEGKTKLAEKDGYYVEWECYGLRGIIYGVEKNGNLYEVGFVAPSSSFKSYLNDAQKSIASFRFTDSMKIYKETSKDIKTQETKQTTSKTEAKKTNEQTVKTINKDTKSSDAKTTKMTKSMLEQCNVWKNLYVLSKNTVNYYTEASYGKVEVSQRVADYVTTIGDVYDNIKLANGATEDLISSCNYNERTIKDVLGGINQNIIDSVEIYKGKSIMAIR